MPNIEIAYSAFPLTALIHRDRTRFRILDCGRRFGKSWMAVIEGFCMSKDVLDTQHRLPRGLIVAPSVQMLRESWKIALSLLKHAIRQAKIVEMSLDLGPLGDIDFKSTESEGGAGRGAGYDWAILDEASRIPQEAWESDIRPALSDRYGRAFFISTPNGRNWFYHLWRKGQAATPAYKSWKYSTIDGWRSRYCGQPDRLALAEAEWQQIQADTSDAKFSQEYQGEFLESQGQFLQLTSCLRGHLRPALRGRHYVAGLDVAHVEDWMATVIIEVETKHVVAVFRSRHLSWALQKADAQSVLTQYPNLTVVIDSTGVGDPIAQDLRAAGYVVDDVVFTPRKKQELVENLSVGMDHGYLGLPDEEATQWLLDEVRAYQETRQPSGAIRYSAPSGQHDDGVTALMLACWGIRWSWQQPVEPALSDHMEVWHQMQEYSNRMARFRRAYPGQPVPMHPRSLAWQMHPRWRTILARTV